MSTAVLDQFPTDNEDAVSDHGVGHTSFTCLGKDLPTAHLNQKVGALVLCIVFSQ